MYPLTMFLRGAAVVLLFHLVHSALPPISDQLAPEGKPFDSIGENFDILSRLVRLANLTQELATGSNYTLFAPNDAAFITSARDVGSLKGVFIGADAEKMAFMEISKAIKVSANRSPERTIKLTRKILLNHVVPGAITSTQLRVPSVFKTMLNDSVIGTIGNYEIVDTNPSVNNPSLVRKYVDVKFARGVIVHVIDRVIVPKFR